LIIAKPPWLTIQEYQALQKPNYNAIVIRKSTNSMLIDNENASLFLTPMTYSPSDEKD
ncbi:8590_t:CDS:2, partial [Gigaspora rosea]